MKEKLYEIIEILELCILQSESEDVFYSLLEAIKLLKKIDNNK